MSEVFNKITLYVEDYETGQEKVLLFTVEDDGSSTLTEEGSEATKDFTIMAPETTPITTLVRNSGAVFEILSKGPITEQEKCEVYIRNTDKSVTPLGTVDKDIPIQINGIVIGFKCETARSGDYPSSYVSNKYYGKIVAIDAR